MISRASTKTKDASRRPNRCIHVTDFQRFALPALDTVIPLAAPQTWTLLSPAGAPSLLSTYARIVV